MDTNNLTQEQISDLEEEIRLEHMQEDEMTARFEDMRARGYKRCEWCSEWVDEDDIIKTMVDDCEVVELCEDCKERHEQEGREE